jgi:predicted DNA-binding protein with PD1-like motif
MQTKLLYDKDPRTVAAVFDTGDEAADGLASAAREHALQAASLTGIGGFSSVVLGYFDPDIRRYRRIPVDEQVEVLSLTGDVALGEDGGPMVHAHVVVGLADGTTRGGHLLEGWVRPTLEVVFLESPGHLQRRTDPETGLPLLRL